MEGELGSCPSLQRLCFLVVWLSLQVQHILAYCDKVEIKDTMYQQTRNGAYEVLSESQWCTSNRPTYRQTGGDRNYLYYLSTGDGWRGWMVGSDKCQNRGGIAAEGNHMTPHEVDKGGWEEVFGGSWYYSPSLHVACAGPLSTGAIIGIVFGCIILLAVIIVIGVCCFTKNNNKHRSTVADVGRAGVHRGRQRGRPQVHVATISHTQTLRQPGYTDLYSSDTVPEIPADFVHMAAPPPYEAEYKYVPPPAYTHLPQPQHSRVQVHGTAQNSRTQVHGAQSGAAPEVPTQTGTNLPMVDSGISSHSSNAPRSPPRWQHSVPQSSQPQPPEGPFYPPGAPPPPYPEVSDTNTSASAPATTNVYANRAFDITEETTP